MQEITKKATEGETTVHLNQIVTINVGILDASGFQKRTLTPPVADPREATGEANVVVTRITDDHVYVNSPNFSLDETVAFDRSALATDRVEPKTDRNGDPVWGY